MLQQKRQVIHMLATDNPIRTAIPTECEVLQIQELDIANTCEISSIGVLFTDFECSCSASQTGILTQ